MSKVTEEQFFDFLDEDESEGLRREVMLDELAWLADYAPEKVSRAAQVVLDAFEQAGVELPVGRHTRRPQRTSN